MVKRLPAMRAARWGRIINLSGTMEPRSINAASAAKAALHLWAKGLSCDVAKEGITVNTIPPGRIESEQIMNKLHPTEEARREFIEKNIPIGYFGKPGANQIHLEITALDNPDIKVREKASFLLP